jgi:hypothetical protein
MAAGAEASSIAMSISGRASLHAATASRRLISLGTRIGVSRL